MPYLWAAYRTGVFSHLPDFPPDLDPQTFRDIMAANVGRIFQTGEAWMFYGKSDKPLGMVAAFISGVTMEPHVFWFPWATPRNRLECALKWIVDMKSRFSLFLWVRDPEWKLFEHLCKYGAIRAVGKYRDFPGGGDAMLYQGVA